jgi:hypothetical protein
VSKNATKLGLFTATACIAPDEREAYDQLVACYMDDLTPESTVEDTLADEIRIWGALPTHVRLLHSHQVEL